MPKLHTQYVCQVCGKITSRAFGRCPGCDSWDSMVEEVVESEAISSTKGSLRGLKGTSVPRRLKDIEGENEDRLALPIAEFARVLGGGIVPGSIVLVGGDPGIGKSTLMLQMTLLMTGELLRLGYPASQVLYVSG